MPHGEGWLMSDDPIPSTEPPVSGPGREALMVWVKLLGMLVALAVFGWVVFRLSRSLH
ncbi:hypothetical protein GCM10009087_01500 [Sphingomonas oligophenolica]